MRDMLRGEDGTLQRGGPQASLEWLSLGGGADVRRHPRAEPLGILLARLAQRRVAADLTEHIVLGLAVAG